MISYKKIDSNYFEEYDSIPMRVYVNSHYELDRINNVPACKFYHKQGAVLRKIDEYAYIDDVDSRLEIQFIWYFDL